MKWPKAVALTLCAAVLLGGCATEQTAEPNRKGALAMASAGANVAPAQAPVSAADSGLVLLSRYLPSLMARLQLTEADQFVDDVAQQRCVAALSYLATASSEVRPEYATARVLCGYSADADIAPMELSQAETAVLDSLLNAAVNAWPAVSNSGVYSFRANWLIRPGAMSASPEGSSLEVEPRPYDVLLHSHPSATSVILHPWMPLPLKVAW